MKSRNKIINYYENEIWNISFEENIKKYKFIATIVCVKFEDNTEHIFGRFDFQYKNSSKLTNLGLKNIFDNLEYVYLIINKMFQLGCEKIDINAADEKKEKRLSFYKWILGRKYKIKSFYDGFTIEKK